MPSEPPLQTWTMALSRPTLPPGVQILSEARRKITAQQPCVCPSLHCKHRQTRHLSHARTDFAARHGLCACTSKSEAHISASSPGRKQQQHAHVRGMLPKVVSKLHRIHGRRFTRGGTERDSQNNSHVHALYVCGRLIGVSEPLLRTLCLCLKVPHVICPGNIPKDRESSTVCPSL